MLTASDSEKWRLEKKWRRKMSKKWIKGSRWIAGCAALCVLSAGMLLSNGTAVCVRAAQSEEQAAEERGSIVLYGEIHADKNILSKELELWKDCYDRGMRHLFIEMPYYTGQLLNEWMQSEEDDIFRKLYDELEGTLSHNQLVWDFYHEIKKACPETMFHGTDVGHQYGTTGADFLAMLEKRGLKDSDVYRIAEENIEQGKEFYARDDMKYRENKMAENFRREYEALRGEDIMGIYGGAHTSMEGMDTTGTVFCMGAQLKRLYGEKIRSEDLTDLASHLLKKPLRTSKKKMGTKTYQASYFGEEDLSSLGNGMRSRKFWRPENAYKDAKGKKLTGEVLTYNNYPMSIEKGQVFLIVYQMEDGSREKVYYRSDGTRWQGMKTTVAFQAGRS